jgi:D-alanyl-D-alanine carboxypeptidase
MLPDTPFFVASITKRFIATLVLQAHERGELHLDDPLTAHLPPSITVGLHVLHGVDHTPRITLHHLLSHTSGLPDHFDRPRGGRSLYRQLAAGEDRRWSFEDLVRAVRDDHTPHFVPQDLAARRAKARYSDTGFQLLIATLERATGRSFATLLTERIVTPLGLERTWLPERSEPVVPTEAPAIIHHRGRALDLPGMIASSNDLMSTPGDLVRFQRALVAGQLFDAPETAARLTERATLLRNMVPIRYGLGTMLFRLGRLNAPGSRPVWLVGHSGATGTWLFHCPELGLHVAGTIDQATGRSAPFRIMARALRAWHG